MTQTIYTFEYCKIICPTYTIIQQPTIITDNKFRNLSTTEKLKQIIQYVPNNFYAFIPMLGTRVLFPCTVFDKHHFTLEQTISLISGRRMQLHHLFKQQDKIHIYKGYIKWQILSKGEKLHLTEMLTTNNLNIWQFIDSVGGCIFPHKQQLHFFK